MQAMPREKFYCHFRPERHLAGPFTLDMKTLRQIPSDVYGVYVLVSRGESGKTIARYVGRGILRERLTEHLNERDCPEFYCKALDDDDEGFAEECRLFHKYGKAENLDNINHPPVPAGAPRNHPRCSEMGCNGERN